MSEVAKGRLDKWLWHARFFKTRSLASKVVGGGKVRINGQHATKASASVSVGDVLTFVQGRQVRVIEVAAMGARRGPASEAQGLYVDRTPPPAPQEAPEPVVARSGPRPTKRDRRQMDRITGMNEGREATSGVDPGEDAD